MGCQVDFVSKHHNDIVEACVNRLHRLLYPGLEVTSID